MSSLVFNRNAAKEQVMGSLAKGVDRMLDSIQSIAVREAPVGKDAREAGKSTRKTRQNAVEAVRRNFTPDRTRYAFLTGQFQTPAPLEKRASSLRAFRERQAVIKAEYVARVRAGGAPPSSRERANDIARSAKAAQTNRKVGSFDFRFQRKKDGQGVEAVTLGRRGSLVEARAPHGNLRSKIHRTNLTIDGSRVSGKVIAGARYSAPVEFGWRGAGRKGSSSHAAHPFMRVGKKEVEANWRDFFKG